jgi:hypothetical protein
MNFCVADQATEIGCILCDDNSILGETPLHNPTVRLAPPTHVQRVDGIMMAGLIQAKRELRRQGLIDEELHAASAQGRPPGRPMSGWLRA